MSTSPKTFLTPEQYLAIEWAAPYKSEYFNGQMFAMAGHGKGAISFLRIWFASCRGSFAPAPAAFGGDMRVQTVAGLYSYPDTTAVCGQPEFLDQARDAL
jgi:hypothetical protein